MDSGGYLVVFPDGVATGTTVEPGAAVVSTGIVVRSAGTILQYGDVASGLSLSGYSEAEYALPSGSAVGTMATDGGNIAVYSGGIVISAVLTDTGITYVYSGGMLTSCEVGSNSVQILFAGAVASGTVVGSDGDESVGGTASNTVVNSGGVHVAPTLAARPSERS